MTRRIAVMVKVVPKPEEVSLDEESMTIDREDADSQLNPADKNAVELALELQEAAGEAPEGGSGDAGGEAVEVVAVSMGPPFVEAQLQDVVAMGADDAYLLSDRAFAGADTYPTSMVLAGAVEEIGDVDLVLCGEESSDSSTGQVPPGIAEWLDAAQVTYVEEAELTDGRLRATRSVSSGSETVSVPLPAVGSVEYGSNEPRFPDFKRKRWAEKEWEATVWDHTDIDVDEDALGREGSHTEVTTLETMSGPEREGEWLEGDPETQAAAIADVLAERVE
ncbi:MAG: electron transfer flavoprotein subunit beta/FixA family protein [Haloarculaceae archaeon]